MVSKKLGHEPINIAIDGYAGSGKSSLARELAKALEYRFVDTGALYRACTLVLLDNGYPIDDADAVNDLLAGSSVEFSSESGSIVLNGLEVERDLRSPRVSEKVSEVAALPQVRDFLLDKQRVLIREKAVVMDGRDIGTVIMPDAELKLFVTARFEVRAQRRLRQLREEGKQVDLSRVMDNLRDRDRLDCTRKHAPLAIADRAVVIDNSEVSFSELLHIVLSLVRPLIDPSLLPHLC